jgi:3-oxoacyl-[acyl-carrier protein] reductase
VKRRALVTGGSGAIGAAICRALARDGLEVIVHANSRIDEARRIAAEIGSPHAIAFDVSDRDAARAALEPLSETGAIQVIVNNAGVHDDAAFPAMRAEQWQRVLAVSLDGFFNVTQPLVMPMVRTRWGRIVSITSVAADIGNRGQVNYAAAKGAIAAASRSLARELGSRGITVNCVSPGLIESPMSAGAFDAAAVERMVPLQRMGRADEVAAAVAFLASDAAGYITGQVVPVNGGMA